MIITIDGPSGVGKGTVAKIISKKLNINYLDSGAMYRALALYADMHNIKAVSYTHLTLPTTPYV